MNTTRFYRNLSDWDLIVQVLHWDGALHERAPWPIVWGAFCLGDGFGKMTGAELRELNTGFDWSHVRDSSESALVDMAAFLRKKLPEILRAGGSS